MADNKRFEEIVHALMNTPLGVELKDMLKDRLINGAHVFSAQTPPEHDKFYLGRHSVYKDLIRIAEKPPTKEKPHAE